MPLFLHQPIEPAGEIGIWEITEVEDHFLKLLKLTALEAEQLSIIKGRRRLEWLAARQLVHHMSGRKERGAFYKDAYGKPHLENSNFQISISHSHEMAAAIAAPFPVGIDIQYLVPSIKRIAHKFISPNEATTIESETELPHMHVYWGAKEALYKAYGRKELDFCQHIMVEPFAFDLVEGRCRGKVAKNGFLASYEINYRQIDQYILVYATEIPNA